MTHERDHTFNVKDFPSGHPNQTMGGAYGQSLEWTSVPVLASEPVDLDQVARQLRERLNALGPASRAESPGFRPTKT